MADPKIQAKQLALAAAQGVAIALSQRGEEPARVVLPPHIVCGLPPYIYRAVFEADAEGSVALRA